MEFEFWGDGKLFYSTGNLMVAVEGKFRPLGSNEDPGVYSPSTKITGVSVFDDYGRAGYSISGLNDTFANLFKSYSPFSLKRDSFDFLINGSKLSDHISGTNSRNIIDGADGNDTLLARGGADEVFGDAGRDTIHGHAGDDDLYGNAGRDLIYGERGRDEIDGGSGDDWIAGGVGADVLTGGSGSDVFYFGAIRDSKNLRGCSDYINDFRHNRDKIDLSGIDARPATKRDDAFHIVGAFDGTAGQIVISKAAYAKTLEILADVNGDGRAEIRIEVYGTSTLDRGDFLL